MPLSLSSFYRHSISKFTPEDATGSITTNTGFIDSGSSKEITLEISTAILVSRVIVSNSSRVQVYSSSNGRANDSSRDDQTAPAPDAGVVLDITLENELDIAITPPTTFLNLDSPKTNFVYLRVTNKDPNPQDITITLYYLLVREFDQRIRLLKEDQLLKANQEYLYLTDGVIGRLPAAVDNNWVRISKPNTNTLKLDTGYKILSVTTAGGLWVVFSESSNSWSALTDDGTVVFDSTNTIPTNGGGLDSITYNPTALEYYTYNEPHNLSQINNGNQTEGVIVTNSNSLKIKVDLLGYYYVNELLVTLGQISGLFNTPESLYVYTGPAGDTLLNSFTLQESLSPQQLSISSPYTRYLTLLFVNDNENSVSVAELTVKGE